MNERHIGQEMVPERFVGIPENAFDAPLVLEGKYGKMVCAVDGGLAPKERTEDALVVDTEHSAFAVIDGMGGMKNAKTAAHVLAEELLTSFGRDAGRTRDGFLAQVRRGTYDAQRRMRAADAGGACFIAARIVGGSLQYSQAGDVRLLLVDRRNGKIIGHSDDEGNGESVSNAVVAFRSFRVDGWDFSAKPNRRVIIASDGIWKSLTNEKVAEIVARRPIEEAFRLLAEASHARMKENPFLDDHRSVILADIDRVSS